MNRVKLAAMVTASLMILYSVHSSGQDFKKAIADLRQRYDKIEKLHAVMSIQAFEDSVSKKPFYNEQADIKRDGKNYVYRFGDQEMLMNSTYLVVVDRSAREIVCSKRDVKGEDDFFGKDPIKMNMDSLFNIYSESRFVGRKNDIDYYRILQKQGTIIKVDMMIDIKANVLKSVAYHYKDGQFVKINFDVFDLQPEFNASTFSESTFMVLEHGKFLAAQAYQNFSITEVKN